MRVLLIEDNKALAEGISNAMRDVGYSIDHLIDGIDGESFLKSQGADVAIIDLNLPGRSGLEIIRGMRRRGDTTPVLILTARHTTKDRLAGFDVGADDYLVKPFEMRELVARLRALARRRGTMLPVKETLGQLEFDRVSRTLTGPAGSIDLPRRELALFERLLDNLNRIVAKEVLVDSIYGSGADIDLNAVELIVSRLRRKLHGSGAEIQTARGLGYMLTAETRL